MSGGDAFRAMLESEVRSRAETVNIDNLDHAVLSAALMDYAGELFVAGGYLPVDDVFSFYREYKKKVVRLNGYSFDDETRVLCLFVAELDHTWNVGSKVTQKDVVAIRDSTVLVTQMASREYLNAQVDPSSPDAEHLKALMFYMAKASSLRVEIVTNKVLAVRRPVAVCDFDVDGKKVALVTGVTDYQRLREFAMSLEHREDILMDFSESGGVPAVISGDGSCALAIVPGTEVARLYRQYGGRLLEGNVRSYLQAKGKVNKGILETIRDDPGKFFSFNNGLTIVCKDFVEGEASRLLSITEPQVVNGGQTTASLFRALEDGVSLEGVTVQAKVVRVAQDEEENAGLIRNISRYSNTQNKISNADLFANDEFLVQLERASRKFAGGAKLEYAYFERSRGAFFAELMRKSGVERARFEKQFPQNRRFSKEDFALAYNAWDHKPNYVSLGGQKNFAEFARVVLNRRRAEFDVGSYKAEVGKVTLFRLVRGMVYAEKDTIVAHRNHILGYAVAVASALRVVAAERLPSIFDQNELTESELRSVREIILKVHRILMALIGDREPGGVFRKSDTWVSVAKEFGFQVQSESELIRNLPMAELLEFQQWIMANDHGDRFDKGVIATIINYAAQGWQVSGFDEKPSPKQTARFLRLYRQFCSEKE